MRTLRMIQLSVINAAYNRIIMNMEMIILGSHKKNIVPENLLE